MKITIFHDDSSATRAGLTGPNGDFALHGLRIGDSTPTVTLDQVDIRIEFGSVGSFAQRLAAKGVATSTQSDQLDSALRIESYTQESDTRESCVQKLAFSQPIRRSGYDDITSLRPYSSQPSASGPSDESLFDGFGGVREHFVDVESHGLPFDSNACMELLGAALRRIIGGCAMRTPKHITAVEDTSECNLAQVSPNIFSPGYLQVWRTFNTIPLRSHVLGSCRAYEIPS